jgi:hypothetical protein
LFVLSTTLSEENVVKKNSGKDWANTEITQYWKWAFYVDLLITLVILYLNPVSLLYALLIAFLFWLPFEVTAQMMHVNMVRRDEGRRHEIFIDLLFIHTFVQAVILLTHLTNISPF